MKKTNVIIVHGGNERDREIIKKYNLPPQNERDWLGWIILELKKMNIQIFNPLMPENWSPKYSAWKAEFEKLLVDENTILVGHSAGAGFLIRWLGESKRKVSKLILVAPSVGHAKEWPAFKDLLDFEINPLVRNLAHRIILITSDNDTKEILDSVEMISQSFNIRPIVLSGRGHFTGKSMGTNEFPELLEKILE